MTKFALITGGSRGLGEQLFRRFWLDGFSVGVIARNHAQMRLIADDLPRRHGQKIVLFSCDLANEEDVSSLVDRVRTSIPRLDVLINNAAIQGPIGPVWENDASDWKRTIQVNLLTPVALCRGLSPMLRGAVDGGVIINLSGGGATGPRKNFSAYATAKAALVRFSETIADELRGDGVSVNCIAPGAMRTSMLEEVLNNGGAAGATEVGLARKVLVDGGVPMDVVSDLALFLVSDAGKKITGKLISSVWDNWAQWPKFADELARSDVYTLRRITGRDRGLDWGDK
jgi:NAD(P)-dependent dehydrogenase (short-subunit alcohol dehydrogenase family)